MILTTGSLRSGDEFINVTVLVVHFSRRTQLLAGKLWLHESTWLRHSEVGMFGSRPQLATLKLGSPHIFKQVFGCLFELGSPQFREVLATVFLHRTCGALATVVAPFLSATVNVAGRGGNPNSPLSQRMITWLASNKKLECCSTTTCAKLDVEDIKRRRVLVDVEGLISRKINTKAVFGWGAERNGAAPCFVWFTGTGAEPSQRANIRLICVMKQID